MPVTAFVVFRYGDRSRECRHDGFVLDDADVYAAVKAVVANPVPGTEGRLVRNRDEHVRKVQVVLVLAVLDDELRGAVFLLADNFEVDSLLVEKDGLGECLGVVCFDNYFVCVCQGWLGFACFGLTLLLCLCRIRVRTETRNRKD